MGKPRARKIKRKQKVNELSNIQNANPSMDQPMEEGSKSEQMAVKIVTEDIQITNKQTSKIMKKKDKRKKKRDKLLGKLQSSGSIKDEIRKAKDRSRSVIVGDMKPLLDALPDVANTEVKDTKSDHLTANSSSKNKQKNWNDKKWKTKRKQELNDIDLFKKVLQLPEYKQDPVCAISSHVEYMVKGDLI